MSWQAEWSFREGSVTSTLVPTRPSREDTVLNGAGLKFLGVQCVLAELNCASALKIVGNSCKISLEGRKSFGLCEGGASGLGKVSELFGAASSHVAEFLRNCLQFADVGSFDPALATATTLPRTSRS